VYPDLAVFLISLFAAFIISTCTFWPELARSPVIFKRHRALNK
jgi:hypothetical protein